MKSFNKLNLFHIFIDNDAAKIYVLSLHQNLCFVRRYLYISFWEVEIISKAFSYSNLNTILKLQINMDVDHCFIILFQQ